MQIIKFVTLINSLRVIKIIKQLTLIIFISQLFKKVVKIQKFYFFIFYDPQSSKEDIILILRTFSAWHFHFKILSIYFKRGLKSFLKKKVYKFHKKKKGTFIQIFLCKVKEAEW